MSNGRERYCWNCGDSLGVIPDKFYDRGDTCGKPACEREARTQIEIATMSDMNEKLDAAWAEYDAKRPRGDISCDVAFRAGWQAALRAREEMREALAQCVEWRDKKWSPKTISILGLESPSDAHIDEAIKFTEETWARARAVLILSSTAGQEPKRGYSECDADRDFARSHAIAMARQSGWCDGFKAARGTGPYSPKRDQPSIEKGPLPFTGSP